MSEKVRTSERVQQHASNDLSGDLSAEGSLSAMPPEFSLTASALDAPDPPDDNGDLTGKRSLVRTDTNLYASLDYTQPICRIGRNTEITVVQDCVQNDWAKIRIEGGESGYLNRNYILQRPEGIDPGTKMHRIEGPELEKANPEPRKFLSRKDGIYAPRPAYLYQGGEYFTVVKNGDTLEQIIQAHYPDRRGMDLRTIANAILFVNNPTNLPNRGIYVKNDNLMDKWMQGIGYNYPDIIIKSGHDILMPSWARILQLRDKVRSGSISLGLVEQIWPDGWGCLIEFSAGLTFVSPSGDVAYNAYFFRKGNRLAIHFSVKSELGLAGGVGGGLSINKRGKKRGIGAEAGIDAEVMGNSMGLIEYEIPMQAGVLANFLWNQATGLFKTDDEKAEAANEFVSTFDDDPAIFVTKAVLQVGTRAQVTGGAGATVMKAGDKAKRTDLGNGREMASYRSKSTERVNQETMVSQDRQSTLKDIRGILGKGQQGIQDSAMSQLGKFMRNLSGISAGAGAGFSAGLEYGHTPKGEHMVSVFLESSAWGSLGLLGLPALAVEAGIGGRLVYVWSKRWRMWQPAAPEMYLFGGDLDNYTANAWELSIRAGDDKPGGDEVDQIIDHLKRMQFTKRFMVTLGTRKLRVYKDRLKKYRSLVGSDAEARGATLKAAVTVDIDLGKMEKVQISALRLIVYKFHSDKNPIGANALGVAKDAIASILNEGGSNKYIELITELISSDTVTNCTVHAEASYGGGIGGKIGGGAKLQVDLAGSVGLVYESSFSGKDVHEFLVPEKSADQNFGNTPDQLPLLAEAINSSQSAMENFATIVMGKGK